GFPGARVFDAVTAMRPERAGRGASVVLVVLVVLAVVALFAAVLLDAAVTAVRTRLAVRRAGAVGLVRRRNVVRPVVALLVHRLLVVAAERVELAQRVAVRGATVAVLRPVANVVAAVRGGLAVVVAFARAVGGEHPGRVARFAVRDVGVAA